MQNPEELSLMIEAEGSNPEIEQIIERYQKVVGAFDAMFLAARPRTMYEAFRFPMFGMEGVGSCSEDNPDIYHGGLTGPAKERIIYLSEQRNQIEGSRNDRCPFHREGRGCVRGNLKGPACIKHFDNPDEWAQRFGIDAHDMKIYIGYVLQQILTNGENPDPSVSDLSHDELVEQAVYIAEKHTELIQQYPILHPEEVEARDRPGDRSIQP